MTPLCSLCGADIGDADLALVPPVLHGDGSVSRIHGVCPKRRLGEGSK